MLRLMVRTKSATTFESIQALDDEIASLASRPIGDEEIQTAKDSILNSFVFRFDSPEKVLQEKMAYEFYQLSARLSRKLSERNRKSNQGRCGAGRSKISASG